MGWAADRGTRVALAGGAGVAVLALLAPVLGEDFAVGLFAAAVVVAVVTFGDALVLLLAAIVATSTYGWVVVGARISVFQVLVGLAALGLVLQRHRELPALAERILRRPETLVLGGLAAWLVTAGLLQSGAREDWAYVRTYAGALVFFVLLACVLRDERARRWVLGAVVLGSAATGIVGLVQLVTIDALVSSYILPGLEFLREERTRLAAPFGLTALASNFSKDVLAGFVVLVPLAAAAIEQRSRWRWWLAGLLVVLGAALVMAASRSAWLGALVALAYVAVMQRRRVPVLVCAVAAAVIVLCIARPMTPIDLQAAAGLGSDVRAEVAPRPQEPSGGARAPSSPEDVPPLRGRRDEASTELSDQMRRRLLAAGLAMVADDPILGIGPGAFRWTLPRYDDLSDISDLPYLPPHNVAMELWSQSGTPALVLYVAFIALVLVAAERRRRATEGLEQATAIAVTAAILALSVTYAFHNYGEDNLLWALSAVAASWAVWPARAEPAR